MTKGETAREHIANALQGLDALDVEAVRTRLTAALAAIDAEAALEPTGIHLEIDWPSNQYHVARRFRRVDLVTPIYREAVDRVRELRRDLRARIGGAPDITLCTKRPAHAAAGE